MRRILLMDIDHTVSDAAWRDKMIGVSSWDEYHLEGDKDQPIAETRELIRSLYGMGWTMVGLTARPEKWRKLSMDWCVRHGIYLDELLMRPTEDRRPSPLVKVSLLESYFKGDYGGFIIALDDRQDVVEAIRAMGIMAIQVFAKAHLAPALYRNDVEPD